MRAHHGEARGAQARGCPYTCQDTARVLAPRSHQGAEHDRDAVVVPTRGDLRTGFLHHPTSVTQGPYVRGGMQCQPANDALLHARVDAVHGYRDGKVAREGRVINVHTDMTLHESTGVSLGRDDAVRGVSLLRIREIRSVALPVQPHHRHERQGAVGHALHGCPRSRGGGETRKGRQDLPCHGAQARAWWLDPLLDRRDARHDTHRVSQAIIRERASRDKQAPTRRAGRRGSRHPARLWSPPPSVMVGARACGARGTTARCVAERRAVWTTCTACMR
jgi:hypothetical protein